MSAVTRINAIRARRHYSWLVNIMMPLQKEPEEEHIRNKKKRDLSSHERRKMRDIRDKMKRSEGSRSPNLTPNPNSINTRDYNYTEGT